MKKLFPFLLLLALGCKKQAYNADLLVKNALVYTVDKNFSVAEAFVVKGGKILAVGKADSLEAIYTAKEVLDAQGKAVYPGFIDDHSHFSAYGQSLQEVHLANTKSWDEIVDSVLVFSRRNADGWIIGRGWDQNKWPVKQFPSKEKLDSLFPVRPVVLHRIDGHAIIANQAALNLAGIKPGQKVAGGEIVTLNGKLTGVLVDNAVGILTHKIPVLSEHEIDSALISAQRNCFADGLTTVSDCGLPYTMVSTIAELQHKGSLKIRLYVLLSDKQENFDYLFKRGVFKTPGLNVRGFKLYADGALGSRGACLLQPYSDRKNWKGYLLSNREHYADIAAKVAAKGFQLCTHAIGDSANRMILQVYASVLKGKNDRRWRVEHAQIVNPADMHYFGDNNIIPSVQPTHATSDMNWAITRLGASRLKTAYAYQDMLKQNGWLALGTDFPVENISPIYTFYAAVVRKDLSGKPESGFQVENALSRKQALQGMTIWAARGNFEENEKGSIEPGKYADFVLLDKDIMKVNGDELPGVNVLNTYVNGEKVYEKK